MREHADAMGCRLVLPAEPEAVLLGSALLGAVAAGAFPSVVVGMAAMNWSTKGHLIAKVRPDGLLDMRYHHLNDRGELMLWTCRSTPERLSDGAGPVDGLHVQPTGRVAKRAQRVERRVLPARGAGALRQRSGGPRGNRTGRPAPGGLGQLCDSGLHQGDDARAGWIRP